MPSAHVIYFTPGAHKACQTFVPMNLKKGEHGMVNTIAHAVGWLAVAGLLAAVALRLSGL